MQKRLQQTKNTPTLATTEGLKKIHFSKNNSTIKLDTVIVRQPAITLQTLLVKQHKKLMYKLVN